MTEDNKQEQLERAGIIAQLIQVNRNLVKVQELQTASLLQEVLLNKLTRKLLYISGDNPKVTEEELVKEIETSMKYVETLFEKVDCLSKRPMLVHKKES